MYLHRLIYQHAETITTPRPSCLDSPEYPIVLALRRLCPGERLTFGVVSVYRFATSHQKARYTVYGANEEITVMGECAAARWIVEWGKS